MDPSRHPPAEIGDAAVKVLGDQALDQDTLVARLAEAGYHLSDGDFARLLDDSRLGEVGGRVYAIPTLLVGTRWTAWINPEDAAKGFVRTSPSLEVFAWWLIADPIDLIDAEGCVLGQVTSKGEWSVGGEGDWIEDDVLVGPDGWLSDVAGGWATFAVDDEALRVAPCPTPPEPDISQVAAVRAGFPDAVEPHADLLGLHADNPAPDPRYTTPDTVLAAALLHDRSAFVNTAVAPVPDLLAAAGLEMSRGLVAENGFDWAELHAWQARSRLSRRWGLTDRQAEALQMLLGACGAYAAEGDGGLGDDGDEAGRSAVFLAALLEWADVARAFWEEHQQRDTDIEEIDAFARRLAGSTGGTGLAGATWLRIRSLDRMDDPVAALDLLDSFDLAACEHLPMLLTAAQFASDRGDARGAYALLRRVEQLLVPGDGERRVPAAERIWHQEVDRLIAEVEVLATNRPPTVARRNDPCPCGSGRKYKACHQGSEQHSLQDRAGWLHQKICRFLRDRHEEALDHLTDIVTQYEYRLRKELESSVLVADLALHGSELMDQFLEARSAVLPDDEALLATQWSLVPWSVFDVREVGRDWLRVQDIRTGDQLTVTNLTPNDATQVGSLLLGRPLPVGETYRVLSGFVGVHLRVLDHLLEALDVDSEEVAEVIAALFAPPQMSNTEGHLFEFHTLRWRVADPAAAVAAALEAAGFEGKEEGRWHLTTPGPAGGRTICGVVSLDGDNLHVEVNSAERAEEISLLIDEALPDATFLSDDVRTFDDMRAEGERTGPLPPGAPADPAMREAMAEIMARMEEGWLDESIPALGGLTPRQAAADPVARERLEQLLASFPDVPDDEVGMMSPKRLRAALGL